MVCLCIDLAVAHAAVLYTGRSRTFYYSDVRWARIQRLDASMRRWRRKPRTSTPKISTNIRFVNKHSLPKTIANEFDFCTALSSTRPASYPDSSVFW